MTILVTGGTGRTGGAVAKLLQEAGVPFLILTRSGAAPAPYEKSSARFDFEDASTYEIPINKANENKSPVKAVFLVISMMYSDEAHKPVMEFVDFARSKGVKRFVLLSSTVYDPPTRICGAVHQHLMDCGDGVEYAIIRPTWFMVRHPQLPFLPGRSFAKSWGRRTSPGATCPASRGKASSRRPRKTAWRDGSPPTTWEPSPFELSLTPR
jgi:uncharacterized protein YbjT (DUF2867 family)